MPEQLAHWFETFEKPYKQVKDIFPAELNQYFFSFQFSTVTVFDAAQEEKDLQKISYHFKEEWTLLAAKHGP